MMLLQQSEITTRFLNGKFVRAPSWVYIPYLMWNDLGVVIPWTGRQSDAGHLPSLIVDTHLQLSRLKQ